MARIATMIALWVIAAWHRLQVVNEAIIGSDSLGPYLQAQAALLGHLPRPPNPESGDALWLLSVPIVLLSDSLEALFSARFVIGGVVAPVAFASAWHWTSETASTSRRWAAAVAAGVFVAFDPGLLDTLVSGARSYAAPELIGLFTLSLALSIRAHPWAPAAAACTIVAAAGNHPLAIGMALGVTPLLIRLHKTQGGRALKLGLAVGAVAAIPRLLRVINLALCGDGVSACLTRVAQSNVTGEVAWTSTLQRALHDRWLVDMDAGAWILLAGLGAILLCRTADHRRAGQFALLGTAGILLIGLSQGYVRSYHLRITAVPIAVAAAMGLARVWPVAIIAAAVFVTKTYSLTPVGPDPGAAMRHDTVARALPDQPLWVDRVWWDGAPLLDPSAVVMSAWLGGRSNFRLGPDTAMVVLQCGGDETSASIASGEGWSALKFEDHTEARQWLNTANRLPHQRGGAYDWATITNPATRLEDARW